MSATLAIRVERCSDQLGLLHAELRPIQLMLGLAHGDARAGVEDAGARQRLRQVLLLPETWYKLRCSFDRATGTLMDALDGEQRHATGRWYAETCADLDLIDCQLDAARPGGALAVRGAELGLGLYPLGGP